MNLKIFVCTHKKFMFNKKKYFITLLCGADLNKDIDEKKIIKDNTGDNISKKNKNYSELTGLYWIWKNMDSKYIGLCHYRRYFNFDNKRYRNIKKIKYREKNIEKILENFDIILPHKVKTSLTIEESYKKNHLEQDWEELKRVIKEKTPEYYKTALKIFNENELYTLNMFIAKKETINGYCEWLFKILFELEKRIKISQDPYQARVFGFISERLMKVYIDKNNLRVKEEEVTFFDENGENSKNKMIRLKKSFFKRLKKIKEIFCV